MDASQTFLDALVETLTNAGAYNSLEQIAPTAVLWPDAAREWELLQPPLRQRLPLLTVGAYDPASATGPAAWVRCVAAHTLDADGATNGRIPVVYLPGVSGKQLAHVEQLPRELALLVELRFRCNVWAHPDGSDWTPLDFLRGQQHGLNVEVMSDMETHEALLRALPSLATLSLSQIRAEAPWKAKDFDALAGFETQAHEVSVNELIAHGESAQLEFKASARVGVPSGESMPALEQVIVKTVAGFLNSEQRGTLLIGVEDNGSICGIEADYKAFKKPGEQNLDGYERWLTTLFVNAFGHEFVPFIRIRFHTIEGRTVCQINMYPAPWPAIVKKDGKKDGDELLYLRTGNATNTLPMRAALAYAKRRWG